MKIKNLFKKFKRDNRKELNIYCYDDAIKEIIDTLVGISINNIYITVYKISEIGNNYHISIKENEPKIEEVIEQLKWDFNAELKESNIYVGLK